MKVSPLAVPLPPDGVADDAPPRMIRRRDVRHSGRVRAVYREASTADCAYRLEDRLRQSFGYDERCIETALARTVEQARGRRPWGHVHLR